MQLVSVTELKSKFSEYLRLAEKEDIIVTYRGKPKGILRYFTADELEDYVISNHPEIRASIEQAQQEIKEGKFVDLNTFIREMEDAE
ncbi:type II toxin-antitoxin system Phd/YefM family antitoxin [bacterium]|nr:type II toxin-antitoxin system Phd/YefM family antitoxin [bacterium]